MESTAEAPARRTGGRPPRGVLPSVGLGVLLVALTLAAFVTADRSIAHAERQLMETRARDAVVAVRSLSVESSAVFARVRTAAIAAHGDPAAFARYTRALTLPRIVSNISLVRVDRGRPEVLVRLGAGRARILGDMTPSEFARVRETRSGSPETLIAWRRDGFITAAYVAPGGAPGRVLIEEVTPGLAVSETFGDENLVYGAVYIGPFESPLTLLGTNAPRLPIAGRRVLRTVQFGNGATGLLVLAPRRPLVGGLAARGKWFVLALGLPLSLVLALGMEALRRRRDRALALVDELRTTNANLDIVRARLTEQAFTDSLTGLGNRARLLQEVERAVERATRSRPPALLVIDLDNFKDVNDLMGHHAGDALLREVAARLAGCAGPEAIAARLGGDEFAILVPESRDVSSVIDLADRIVADLETPILLHSREVVAGASIGICRREGGESPDEFLRNADIAMYRVKAQDGPPRWAWFVPGMLEEFRDRLALVEELRQGVEAGEFELDFQPIRELGSGRTVGAEALVRWRHPRRGRVAPLEFIPVAEETGVIVPLGAWVLEEACRRCAGWLALGSDLRVSVNVSGRQLQEPDIVAVVRGALTAAGLAADRLIVEITESVLIEDEAVTHRLQELREMGVRIAVDDFGAGYSSIEYLRRFPLDILKIDRAFVTRVGEAGRGALLESIVRLGRSLGLVAVAEGVESERDEEGVRQAMCDYAQGYRFSRPVGPEEFEMLLLAECADAVLEIAATTEDDGEPGSAG